MVDIISLTGVGLASPDGFKVDSLDVLDVIDKGLEFELATGGF